ncbi:hypothetical protein L226DRAFT_527591 [Lentinus tigrinus ALCF2SS1-7]|uniref:uncharacterized protein n=1 Tax=Lentinus tigrinus ALCF2SS1-7 TaxID=1328758 RepID=UPI001165C8BD|nr:hypothetical protein L226DRAFT_527591 [Lentinus tigrinus ALCF2SS1-7]
MRYHVPDVRLGVLLIPERPHDTVTWWATLPSQKMLADQILDNEAWKVEDLRKQEVNGRYATRQCDGWKNVARVALIASMPWLLNVTNIMATVKTATNLFNIVLKELQYCTEKLSIIVVAWCTNAAVDCWAHQINLLVGDYFKVKPALTQFMNAARELIKWFNNHMCALAWLQEEQEHCYTNVQSLLYPVATNWLSHYVACARLLNLKTAVRCLITLRLEDLVAPTPKGWNILKMEVNLRNHLLPFVITTDITQSNHVHLDTAVLTLAMLFHIHLEKRWLQLGPDCEVFLITLVLNPYIRDRCFRQNNPAVSKGELSLMFKCVFTRLMEQKPNSALIIAFNNYLAGIGQFLSSSLQLDQWWDTAIKERTNINLAVLWGRFDVRATNGENTLFTFSTRIASIIPNTAATEHEFSKMDMMHMKWSLSKTTSVVLTLALHTVHNINHTLNEDDPEDDYWPENAKSGMSDLEASAALNGSNLSVGRHSAHFFSLMVACAVSAATCDAVDTHGDDVLITPTYVQEGLTLCNLFDYSSPTFMQIMDLLCATGQHAIDAEVICHEQQSPSLSCF